jgi:hypothetical protein
MRYVCHLGLHGECSGDDCDCVCHRGAQAGPRWDDMGNYHEDEVRAS